MQRITRIKRAFERTQDHDGRDIVLVPLANHDQPARLFADDWDRLMRAAVSPQWTLNKGDGIAYVRCSAKTSGGLDTVARLIMRAGAGQVVGYRSSDRLNLRSDNLRIKRRSVGRRPARTPQVAPLESSDAAQV